MTVHDRVLKHCCVYVLMLCLISSALATNAGGDNENIEDEADVSNLNSTQTSTPNSFLSDCGESNEQNGTSGHCANGNSISQKILENKGMLKRTFIVLLLVTAIVVVYFVIRAARLRRSRKTRKYGLLARPDKLEMQPLDMDDDEEDEDVTVYEMNGRHK